MLCCAVLCCALERGAVAQFTPFKCNACPATTPIAYSYNTNEYPTNPQDPLKYINALFGARRYITGNKYLKQFDFYINSFSLEWSADFFRYGSYPSPITSETGNAPVGWRSTSSTSLQAKPSFLQIDTDFSVTLTGVSVSTARVCCDSGSGDDSSFVVPVDGSRVSGVLLATHDVVFLKGNPYGGEDLAVALSDTQMSGGHDFDLYARCGIRPTTSAFYAAGTSADNSEFLHLPSSACVSPSQWFFAIYSYTGQGVFELAVTRHKVAKHLAVLRAGTNFTGATPAQMQNFAALLLAAMKYWYALSKGTIYLSQIDLYNNGNCVTGCGGQACQVCFVLGTGGVCQGGRVDLGPPEFYGDGTIVRGRTLAHEWGHCLASLPDEYEYIGFLKQCGHTIMAEPYSSNYNLCINDGGLSGGYAYDHNYDPDPGASYAPSSAGWNILYSNGNSSYVRTWTPDNYSYANHDFGGAFVVAIK